MSFTSIHSAPRPSVRSAYYEQIRQIAPHGGLLDREAPLAELAAFATASGPGPDAYLWWRAPAWSGKTALMSWFALHPPAGVDLVSFFITARFAAQSDRLAFVDVVVEQLAELIGEDLPGLLTPATGEAHLRGLLVRAARMCHERNRRLVLLVDGLDEDTGVTAGPDSHSIAALLPAEPAHGLKVIVAGRPDPPMPADVPDDHPLRTAVTVRTLSASAHAKVRRDDAERELARLLHGAPEDRELLGLVAAAAGGLTRADLEELTGRDPGDIRASLHAVTGRTFAVRADPQHAGDGPDVYLLAHEELQVAAVTGLGRRRLSAYRDLLHAWAATYRSRGWPPQTPGYLLRGYHPMLLAQVDAARLVALGTDAQRHERMRLATGSEAAALSEIAATIDLIGSRPDPDLSALARLAMHRDELVGRDAALPASIPGVLAAVGRPARAEALARTIGPGALADVAVGAASRGDLAAAHALASEVAMMLDGTLVAPGPRDAELTAKVVGALAAARDYERAESLARTIHHPRHLTDAVMLLARALVADDQRDRAVRLVSYLTGIAERWHGHPRRPALIMTAKAWMAVGQTDRALALAESIEATDDPRDVDRYRPGRLADLMEVFAAAGRPDRARELLVRCIEITNAIVADGHGGQVTALLGVARAGAALGYDAWAIDRLYEALGEDERLREKMRFGRGQAREVFHALIDALGAAGEVDRAEEICHVMRDPADEAEMLAGLAMVVLAAGDLNRASRLAGSTIAAARKAGDHDARVTEMARLAELVAGTGDRDTARLLLLAAVRTTIAAPNPTGDMYGRLAAAAVAVGDREAARRCVYDLMHAQQFYGSLGHWCDFLGDGVDAVARDNVYRQAGIAVRMWRYGALGDMRPMLAVALASAGRFGRAGSVAWTIGHRAAKASTLARMAAAASRSGRPRLARRWAASAARLARRSDEPDRTEGQRDVSRKPGWDVDEIVIDLVAARQFRYADRLIRADPELVDRFVAAAYVGAGDLDRAADLVAELPDAGDRVRTLALMAAAVPDGRHPSAGDLLAAAEAIVAADPHLDGQVLAERARAHAAAGDVAAAESLAHRIASSGGEAALLAELAVIRYRAADPAEAVRLLTAALRTGSLVNSLEALAVVDPAALVAAATERLSMWHHLATVSVVEHER